MHDLVAISPLGGTEPRVDRVGPVTLSERPDWALASVAARLGREQDCCAGLKTALGQGVPEVGRLVAGDPLSAFWTGPEQWMVEAPHASHEDLAARLKTALGDAASVTEQTDGWCRFDMEGDGVVAVLERLCNVDVVTRESGTATRTSIEHLGCFLLCRIARRSLSVIGPRSSAASLHHALLTAMRSALWRVPADDTARAAELSGACAMTGTAHTAEDMIGGMSPELRPGRFVFVSTRDAGLIAALSPGALSVFREDEGLSLLVPVETAVARGLPVDQPMRCITLCVYSSLDGVGLTAAVSTALAEHAIPCNMIAAFHHDHLCVPEALAQQAMDVLLALQRSRSGKA